MDIELVKHKRTQVYEASLKFADGLVHQVMFSKFVFSGVNEEDSVLLGIMIDITERKQAEEKKCFRQKWRLKPQTERKPHSLSI